jgi:hypothetical protein
MGVRLVALELVGRPQESLTLDSLEELVLKLQVEDVRPKLFSAVVAAAAVFSLCRAPPWMGVGATDPGVRVGSSVGSFRAAPFQI